MSINEKNETKQKVPEYIPNVTNNITIVQQVAPTVVNTPFSSTETSEGNNHRISDIDTTIPTTPQKNENTFVLIIANENYKKEASVPFAGNDGNSFEQYCHKTLGVPKTNIHTVSDATLNEMRHEIKWLQDIISVYKGDVKLSSTTQVTASLTNKVRLHTCSQLTVMVLMSALAILLPTFTTI